MGHQPGPNWESVLARHVGRRERVLDEHMYRIVHGPLSATFRLQLFTALGCRPVAVTTQTMDEGYSLVNGREHFVVDVWRTNLEDEPQPPLWVERLLLRQPAWTVTVFESNGGYRLGNAWPVWQQITQQQLDDLVGQAVDPERGTGFIPWPTQRSRVRFTVVPMAAITRSRPFRTTCMTTSRWSQLLRWPRRQRLSRDCCWYHGGDWHLVHADAVRLLRAAEAAGALDDLARHVLDAAAAERMTGWHLEALTSLFGDPIRLEPGKNSQWLSATANTASKPCATPACEPCSSLTASRSPRPIDHLSAHTTSLTGVIRHWPTGSRWLLTLGLSRPCQK